MPRSEEILEIYDEFEKNYNHVKMLNPMAAELNYESKIASYSLNK